ncbi:hypothetical protein RR46_02831 [Papilio xuthus]|uniref:Uncharacterized protein n=1 Tax=Papilio xuthus TaxID=66420 RepID=A0A194QBV9_PAPXU|nr:hypothetical protein RR46_02831 [Papilio xuthus]
MWLWYMWAVLWVVQAVAQLTAVLATPLEPALNLRGERNLAASAVISPLVNIALHLVVILWPY